MTEELKQAVIKALQKNHRNGPIHAKNLASVYENIINENQTSSAEKIAAMINDEEMKSDGDDDSDDEKD